VAVLDVDMPEAGGFEVVREMQKLNLHTEAIFLTMYKDEGLFNKAMDMGVKGYVLKDSAIGDIVASVKAVAAGQNYISQPMATYLVNRSRRLREFVQQTPSINDLTPTERRILRLIADSKTSREIAAELFISIRTVERHRLNICDKLDIHGSNALIRFALENKQQLL
jgi:DNA-binding NarL/FixJ family response regulator